MIPLQNTGAVIHLLGVDCQTVSAGQHAPTAVVERFQANKTNMAPGELTAVAIVHRAGTDFEQIAADGAAAVIKGLPGTIDRDIAAVTVDHALTIAGPA